MTLSDALRRIKRAEKLVISPRMEDWLVKHPEGVVLSESGNPKAKKELLRLMSDTSNSQRSARFGASSRGTCLRHQLFVFLGMPGLVSYDPRLQNLFNDGTWRHIRHQIMGLQAEYFTGVETPFKSKEWSVKTSADAVNEDEDWFFELKGTSLFGKIVHEGPPEAHLLQIHTVMLVTGYTMCVYLIEDKRTQDWHEMVIRRDPQVMSVVKRELDALNESLQRKKLPRIIPSCAQRKGALYQGCQFRKTCPSTYEWPEQGVWPSEVQVRRRKKKAPSVA